MAKIKKVLLVILVAIVPFCLGAAGLKEAYNCGQAAQLLQINADAYRTPAPTAEEILGGLSPYAPLTHMEGCEMILRAFGPLPDVQEGVRYLIKYRDCAFTDVPQEGKEAVDNLVNAGLYIPKDNTVFGPNQLMTEEELAVLIDRIHAYLQSSPKDDYYSWATADLVNDPDFLNVPYDIATFANNMVDIHAHQTWIINMLNDCLENPDTPEKKNIAAAFSTYMDMEERENSLTYIKPMVDAIWNAPDYETLINVCADICASTGFDVLLERMSWTSNEGHTYTIDGHMVESLGFWRLNRGYDPNDYLPGKYEYEAYVEQQTRMLSRLGIDKEAAEEAFSNFVTTFCYQAQIIYNSSDLPKVGSYFYLDNLPEELQIFPWAEYLQRAGYENQDLICVEDHAEMAITLALMAMPENLAADKAEAISNLVENLIAVVPLTVMDARKGFWDDYYAAEPSLIFEDNDLNNYFLPLVQVDIFEYYSKTDEYRIWKEYLENLCNRVIYNYRRMLSETEWLTEETKSRALEKIDGMGFELLIPKDRSNLLRVEYVSAEEGGTLFENLVRYLKARRSWVYNHGTDSVLDYEWSTWNCWKEYPFYTNKNNTFYLTLSDFIASHITPQSSEEEVMGYLGTIIGHEISHAFDYNGSYFNTDGKVEDWWTEEDRSEFTERAYRLAEYMEDYEFLPGFSIRNGIQVVNEAIADLTSMKCMMRIAAEIPDFDYEKFFYAFANSYAISSTRRGADYFLLPDEHPNGRTRVNRILSATDEFYRTFDIQSGDAMYVSPEDRPKVW